MTGRRASLIWLMALVIGLATISAAWLIPYFRYVREQRETVSRLENERQKLAKRVEELTAELNTLKNLPPSDTGGEDAGEAASLAALSAEERGKRLSSYACWLLPRIGYVDRARGGPGKPHPRAGTSARQGCRREVSRSRLGGAERLSSANRVIEAQQEELKANPRGWNAWKHRASARRAEPGGRAKGGAVALTQELRTSPAARKPC
jgi:hypothetical protein